MNEQASMKTLHYSRISEALAPISLNASPVVPILYSLLFKFLLAHYQPCSWTSL